MDAIRYFRESAKTRLREMRAHGDAIPSLQQIQHQVATAAGFRSWGELINADDPHLRLAVAMDREIDLNMNGFGPGSYTGTPEEQLSRATRWRSELRAHAAHVSEVCEWLDDHIDSRKTLNDDAHSYGLKHLAERSMGSYVSNGELIAAAIVSGYPYRRNGQGSPNAIFGMSSRSISALRQSG